MGIFMKECEATRGGWLLSLRDDYGIRVRIRKREPLGFFPGKVSSKDENPARLERRSPPPKRFRGTPPRQLVLNTDSESGTLFSGRIFSTRVQTDSRDFRPGGFLHRLEKLSGQPLEPSCTPDSQLEFRRQGSISVPRPTKIARGGQFLRWFAEKKCCGRSLAIMREFLELPER
jgi:hypothetical protein